MKEFKLFILVFMLFVSASLFAQRRVIDPTNPYNPSNYSSVKMDSITAFLKIENRLKDCNYFQNFINPINGIPTSIKLYSDRIEFLLNSDSPFSIYFSDIADDLITDKIIIEKNTKYSQVSIAHKFLLNFTHVAPNRNEFADALFTVQKLFKERKKNSELQQFHILAKQYTTMSIKPDITEEQRKFIVQATVYTEQKEYDKAISLFQQVNEINPVSFPAAYFNLAILYELNKNYPLAIFNMKKYLMLTPYAEDARSNQDKIYEWELK